MLAIISIIIVIKSQLIYGSDLCSRIARILSHSLAFSHSPASFLAFLARFFPSSSLQWQILCFSISQFVIFSQRSHLLLVLILILISIAQNVPQRSSQRSSSAGHPQRILISLTVAVFPAIDYISSYFPLPLLLLLLLLLQLLLLLWLSWLLLLLSCGFFHSLKYLFIYCCSQRNNRAIYRSLGSVIAEFKWVRSASAHESDYQHCNKCFEIVNKEKVLKNRILKLLLVGCKLIKQPSLESICAISYFIYKKYMSLWF